jgi:phospholipid/cholesterol/gamma-HCH transport system substrate-binding protein
MTGIIALNNFADIPQWICSSIEAASRARLARVSKLCLQYINPIIKNRIYNYIPAGLNPFVGTQARPNEITYSEDWLRPGYTPPPPPDAPSPADGSPPAFGPAPGPVPPVEGQLPADPPSPPPNSLIDSTQVLRNLLLPTGQP